ncbi:C-X-C motif chemokine 13-like [Anabas testudineus]|uniref:Chemokine interleukin-8-like domain-containing protein n=1 Tax=Anabas testudineus TaxID=64144 RepID=A0A7N6F841_ANATE|nr:C-X-C motif chemokine 13-like [Anabas testudineus]
MTKPMLFLAALTLYCCIAIMPAFARDGCRCIRYSTNVIPKWAIKKVEILPPSGHCRRPEIIITTRKGIVHCTKPGLQWVDDLISFLQRQNRVKATLSPTASTTREMNV